MTFNATVLAVILLTLGAFTIYIVRGMIQSARKPRGMATPHKDSRNWSQNYMDSIK